MDLDAQSFLNLVILAAGAVTAIASLPAVIMPLARLLKGKGTAQDLNTLTDLAAKAVTTVEQTMRKAPSDEKLRIATEKVMAAVKLYNIRVTEAQVQLAIESAVFFLPAGQSLPPAPSDVPTV